MHIETLTRDSTFDFSKIEIFFFITVKVKLAYFFSSFFFSFYQFKYNKFSFLMIFIQEYTMFWFGFDDARRHLFVWNIILKHDVVINYQRIPYKLGIVCAFFLLPEIGTVKRRLTDNFSWGLFVWDKLFHGRGSTHLSQVMPRPPLKFADSHNGQDLQVYGMVLFNHLSSKNQGSEC